MWKDLFYFSRGERKGIVILIILLISVIGFNLHLSNTEIEADEHSAAQLRECNDFLASVREKELNRQKKHYTKEKEEAILFPFDPNTADSAALTRLGLPPYIAKNILRYRAKGGVFRTPEAFAKIYGIGKEQFGALLPYIMISEEFRPQKDSSRLYAQKEPESTLKYFKYAKGTIINLNEADTTELKKIPGIGNGIAARIVYYRNKLGGFYKVAQLQDLPHVSDSLNQWFSIKNSPIHRINLNKSSIERLKSHPYMNFYQAQVIVEYRKKKGSLKSLKQLALFEEFTEKDIDRLGHYICF